MSKKQLFPSNNVVGITESDYADINKYITPLKAIAHMAYQGLYIIDYYRKGFLFVAPNPMLVGDISPLEMKRKGYNIFEDLLEADELDKLQKINDKAHEFLYAQPMEKRYDFCLSYNLHIQSKKGPITVNHQLTPLALDREGHVWLSLCLASMAGGSTPDVEIRRVGYPSFWRLDDDMKTWEEMPQLQLSEGERNVLMLSTLGLTTEELAKRLGRAKDSIKSRKRAIYEKLHVNNICQAILCAQNKKLI